MKSFLICSGIVAGALAAAIFLSSHVFAAPLTNISPLASQHWAWNDEIGWMDFFTTDNVMVTSAQLTGYASSSAGPISLDCGTAPDGSGGEKNICGTSNYRVNNDGNGNLSGWAWNDEIGWISFYWGNASANPAAPTTALCQSYGGYCGVSINGTTGVFQGWAWNDTVGWISFNCSNTSSCGTSNFDVVTSWAAAAATGTLYSQVFDTGVVGGAQMNSITWKGTIASGTSVGTVGFQIAVSNSSSGPWNFIGPGGTSGTTYTGTAGTPIPLGNYSLLVGRYFRYSVILGTNVAQTFSPSVTSVIVNWSP
jgi:hypothetical protein